MIKHLSTLATTALALSIGSAAAADLPSVKGPPLAPPPPPPLWTGFYVGLNAGGSWSDNHQTSIATFDAFGNPAAIGGVEYGVASAAAGTGVLGDGSNGGFIGGGQIGYNFQFANSFVAGIEADIQGIAQSNSTGASVGALPVPVAGFTTGVLASTLSSSKRLDYLGTVRGRLGFLITPSLLVYGTGGLAYGGVNSSAGVWQYVIGIPGLPNPFGSSGGFSDTRAGWTAGGGVEWMFLPRWSARIEYLYYDLGRVTYALSPLANFNSLGVLYTVGVPYATTNFSGHVVRAGVNYHFDLFGQAPVVAKF